MIPIPPASQVQVLSPVPMRRTAGSVMVLVGIAAAVGLGLWIGHETGLTPLRRSLGWTFAAFSFGALVGLSEILSRYRDEPLLATATTAGMSYLAFNGVISTLAFAVLRKYPNQIFPGISQDLFLTSVVAGFGGMVIFRSKLFTYKSADGSEYPIGPAIVLDTILKMIDSKIDRRRATDRQTRVFNAMCDIHDFPSTANYMEASLFSFQNLSPELKTAIRATIQEYRTSTSLPDTLKGLALGYAFLTLAGDANFDLFISNLKRYVESQAATPVPAIPVVIPPNPSTP